MCGLLHYIVEKSHHLAITKCSIFQVIVSVDQRYRNKGNGKSSNGKMVPFITSTFQVLMRLC